MRQNEESHIMDNVIYNDLIQRGCFVDVGIVKNFTKDSEGKTQDFFIKVYFIRTLFTIKHYIKFYFQ